MLVLNFRLSMIIFSPIFLAISIKISKVYFIFLISVFAIFNMENLNVVIEILM